MTNTLRIAIAVSLLASGAAQPLTGGEIGSPVPTVTARRVASAPVIDGRLDDPQWSSAEPVDTFVQQDPHHGQPPTRRTEVRVLYDDRALYIGARLDEPERVTRLLARRDSYLASDWFAVYLDPHHDHRSGAMFRVNPAGVVRDASLADDDEDRDWDAVWSAATTTDESGWTVEMAIPFSQLRFPTGDDRHQWGINFHREIAINNEVDRLVIVPRDEHGFITRFAHLDGLRDLAPARNLEILPYVVASSATTSRADAGPFAVDGSIEPDAGLDLKYGLSSNLTLTATINPDFGQVEADPAEVNLTAFELFFSERRPFFIEGSRHFDFNAALTLFYSRRIGRTPQITPRGTYSFIDAPSTTTILGAAKLTGRTAGGWSVGVLDAYTDRERATILHDGTRSTALVEPRSNHFVSRISRELDDDHRLGFIVTSVTRDLDDREAPIRDEAFVGGLDGTHHYGDRNYRLSWGVAGSRVTGSEVAIDRTQRSSARYFQRPDSGHDYDPSRRSLDGWTAMSSFEKLSGRWRFGLSGTAISPGFESNDLGFQQNADRATLSMSGSWRDTKPSSRLRSRGLRIHHAEQWNFDGDRVLDRWYGGGSLETLGYHELSFNWRWDRDALDDRETRGGPLMLRRYERAVSMQLQTDRRRPVSLELEGGVKEDGFGGYGRRFGIELTWRPRPHIRLEIEPFWSSARDLAQYVRTVPDELAAGTYGHRYVFGEIDRTTFGMPLRVDWSFTPNLSLQLYVRPFVASGDYVRFRELRAPARADFIGYGIEAGTVAYDEASRRWTIDPDGSGPAKPFAIADPDFNFRSVRGNAVVRWEYRPGSTLYLAWNRNSSSTEPFGDFRFRRDIGALDDLASDDVFLLKVSYWLGL